MNETNLIEKAIMEFNKDIEFQELRNRYNTPTILDMLSVERSETAHSAMLKWLLQGSEIITHEKDIPLVRFLDILLRRNSEQENDKIEPALRRAILGREIRFSDLKVETEKWVSAFKSNSKDLDDCKDRIDIYIEATLSSEIKSGANSIKEIVIVIENKIKSKEGGNKDTSDDKKTGVKNECYNHSDQTKRYYLAVMPGALDEETKFYEEHSKEEFSNGDVQMKKNIHNGTHYLFVYLTPLPNAQLKDFTELDADNKAACPQYIQINYQDIADEIITPLLKADNQTQRVRTLLYEYMNALTIPGKLEDEQQRGTIKKELLIMATSDDDKKLLNTFYENYKELIKAAIGSDKSDNSGKSKDEVALLKVFKEQNLSIIIAALKILLDNIEGTPASKISTEELNKLYDMVSGRKRQKYEITCGVNEENKENKENKETVVGHTALVVNIVKKYAKGKTAKDVMEAFNTNEFVKTPKEIVYPQDTKKDKTRYSHEEITCSDGIIYCSNQWVPENIEQFIKHIEHIKQFGYKVKKV